MFGRETITLGIGPHSSSVFIEHYEMCLAKIISQICEWSKDQQYSMLKVYDESTS